jgi:hypothetical protein
MFRVVIRAARAYRDGAHTRVVCGGSLGDDAYSVVYDEMLDDAYRIVEGDMEFAHIVRGIFYRAAQSGARMAAARQPLPGQDRPSYW